MESMRTSSESPQTVASYAQIFEYEVHRMRALEEFINLKPPFFKGGPDPLEAETWLDTIKTMFDSIEVLPKYRIGFAGYLFEGAAEEWWDKKDYEKDGKKSENTRWKRFELLFRRMYCRPPDWDAKTRFLNLIQDNKSVAEYTAEFEATLRCCDPSMQADLVLKRTKFMTGLKKKISIHIRPFEVTDFDVLVEVALGVEADQNRRLSEGLASCFLCGSEDPKMCSCPSRQLKEMTVVQYRAEFAEHYRSSTVSTEAGRVLMSIRFRCGLFPPIKAELKISKTFHDFDTLVAAAESAEALIEQRKKGKLAAMEDKRKEKEEQEEERQRQEREKKEGERVGRLKQQEEEQKAKEEQKQQEEEQRQEREKKKEKKQKKHLETLKQQQEMPKQKKHLETLKQQQEMPKLKKSRRRSNLMPSFGLRCPHEPENKMPKVEFVPKKELRFYKQFI